MIILFNKRAYTYYDGSMRPESTNIAQNRYCTLRGLGNPFLSPIGSIRGVCGRHARNYPSAIFPPLPPSHKVELLFMVLKIFLLVLVARAQDRTKALQNLHKKVPPHEKGGGGEIVIAD